MSLVLTASGEELRKQFFALRTSEDVAKLLEVEHSHLIYHLYITRHSKRYTTFYISKKSGGSRKISTPVTGLKIIQQKLNQVLQHVYQPKPSVNSFIVGRSIVANAKTHSKQRFVFNIDLKDFFPSINFGRVRGLFIAVPYKLDPSVATVLAQICCFDNGLPQGAPTSPIISNMICAKMDSQLQHLAKKHKCIYTRYADDITFSTSMRAFPNALAKINSAGQLEVGDELGQIITENGFEINPKKVRLQTKDRRQEVTGLTTNKFPNVRRQYIRQIRAMLHAWEKFGLEAAEAEFLKCYGKKHRSPWKDTLSFKQVVRGKIEFLGMVRGKDNEIYQHFCDKLGELAPELRKYAKHEAGNTDKVSIAASIVTEGKTDWKHLKAALVRLQNLGYFSNLKVEFREFEDNVQMGSAALKDYCVQLSKFPQPGKVIGIFDRDEPNMLKQISTNEEGYKDWGNNVYSFAIPVPMHREDNPEISIELYYKDTEITRIDKDGRRLFLSNEFDDRSGKHRVNKELNCTILNKIRSSKVSIIDSDVFNQNDQNIALPKSKFADYVLSQVDNFSDFDVSEFRKIFDIIAMIIKS